MENKSCTAAPVYSADTFIEDVSREVRNLLQIINCVAICSVVSLFGIGANIVNICVFSKQGFTDSTNISLLSLSVADLVCSVTMLWTSTCYNLLLHDLDLPFEPMDVMYFTGGFIHVCFNRITSFITAFITFERCLCITMPLKIKTIITPFKTKFIMLAIFSSTAILFAPFCFVNNLDWKFNPSKNRSLLSFTSTSKDKEIVESVSFFIHSVFLSSALLLTVVVCTIILAVKLIQKTKWRLTSSTKAVSKPGHVSVKDKKVVKMITLIAAIFLICYIPPTVVFLLAVIFSTEFNLGGKYENMVFTIWSCLFVLDAVNSSVNIFVYFNMSSKYRATFLELMCVLSQDTLTSFDVN